MSEDENHEDDSGAIDAQGQQARSEPLVRALGSDESENLTLPVVDEGRGDDLQAGLAGHLRQSPVERLLGGAGSSPGALRGQTGPLGLGDQELDQGGADRLLDALGRRRTSPQKRRDAVADPPHLHLQGPEQVPSAHELLPTGQHLAMQHGAVLGGLDDTLESIIMLGGGCSTQLGVLSLLGGQLDGEQLALCQEGTNGAGQAAVRDVLASGRVGGQRPQPLAQR